MAGIIKREFHVFAAESFVDELNTEGNQENDLYIGISRTTAWADENNPPTPTDSDDDMYAFWSEIQGLIKIGQTATAMVVPRKDWTSGTTNYVVFDSSLASAAAYAENFYVRNQYNEVYEITAVPADTVATPALVEPSGEADVNDGAGYTYRYLYTINLVDNNRFLTDNWMPVEFEDNYDAANPLFNHLVLGAKYVMVYGLIDKAGIIPDNITYRQVALVRNPLLNDNVNDKLKSRASASEIITFTNLVDGTEPTSVVRGSATFVSGELMYLDNRHPLYRDPDQSEEIKLIVEF